MNKDERRTRTTSSENQQKSAFTSDAGWNKKMSRRGMLATLGIVGTATAGGVLFRDLLFAQEAKQPASDRAADRNGNGGTDMNDGQRAAQTGQTEQSGLGAKAMFATKNGTSYKIKFGFGTGFLVLEFNQLGINKIIHPKKLYRDASASLTPDFTTPVLWNTITTDWVSPYKGITALHGATSTFAGTVGGNHGTVGGEGMATARSVTTAMYADGVLVNDNDVAACDEVKLVTTNFISASNKINVNTGEKADSLEETVTYTVTPNHMEVSVSLKALEDLQINGYVGLQMTTNMFAGEVYFNDSANKYALSQTKIDSLPLPFAGDRVVYSDADHVIVTYTDRTYGLGDLSYKATAPVHFLSAFHKIYSHLLGKPITVLANDTISYRGGYTIDVPMRCDGCERAYTIKLDGVLYYCVDFLQPAADVYLELGPELIGKQIDIVEQSATVSCDTVIGTNGLRISATGFGQLKWKLKD